MDFEWVSTYGAHGTACAGLIGASQNDIGISGVAPECRLISISNELSHRPTSIERRSKGINWAWKHDANIINCSWKSIHTEYISDAIDSAVTFGRGGKGCILVCSSGNENLNSICFPANMPNTIAVGAVILMEGELYLFPVMKRLSMVVNMERN